MKEKKHYWFRKWIAIALAAMLCAGTLSVNVFAADEQSAGSTIEAESAPEAESEMVDEAGQEESEAAEDVEKDSTKETAAEDTNEEDPQEEKSVKEDAEKTDENSEEQAVEKEEVGETAPESDSSKETAPSEGQNDQDTEPEEDKSPSEKAAEDTSAPTKTGQKPALNSAVTDDPLRMNVSSVTLESGENDSFYNYSSSESIQSVSSSNPDVASVKYFDSIDVMVTAGIVGEAVISVTGTNGTVVNIEVSVIFNGDPLAFDENDVTVTAGDTYYIDQSTYSESIKSISVSNPKIVAVNNPTSLDITGLMPGKAVLTVTGSAGTKCTINVTVKSFMTVSSINVYAGSYRYVDFVDGYEYGYDFSVATSNYKIATSGIAWNEETDYEDKLIIRGQSVGKAVITVKGQNNSACTVNVNVINPPLNLSASSLLIDRVKNYEVTSTGSDISTVVSSNTKICTAKKTAARKVKITPLKAGTAKLTLKNKYGVTKTVNVTITSRYFLSCVVNLSKPMNQSYGSGYINGTGAPNSKASVVIGGKTYSTTVNAKGNFVIRNVPYIKIGTVVNVKFTLQGQSATKKIKILKGSHSVYTPNYTYKDSTSVSVQVKNVHSGDKIKITVNGKNYYRTFKNTYKTITVDVNIKKPGKYGITMTTRLLNKFDQEMAKMSEYVYLSDTVHVGDSKSKVKWLTYWNDPDHINYYSTGEQWCYDWKYDDGISDAYLYFDTNGKVTDWWIED